MWSRGAQHCIWSMNMSDFAGSALGVCMCSLQVARECGELLPAKTTGGGSSRTHVTGPVPPSSPPVPWVVLHPRTTQKHPSWVPLGCYQLSSRGTLTRRHVLPRHQVRIIWRHGHNRRPLKEIGGRFAQTRPSARLASTLHGGSFFCLTFTHPPGRTACQSLSFARCPRVCSCAGMALHGGFARAHFQHCNDGASTSQE